MFLSYDGIMFEILKMDNWLREAVYTEDLTTFLYWHHVIEVTCILNDDATNAENFPKVIKKQKQFTENSLKKNGVKFPMWQGSLGTDKPVNDNDPLANDPLRAMYGLELIDPRTLIDVSSKGVGGSSVGSPGENKGFSSEKTTTTSILGEDITTSLDAGVAKGGPGPLPDQLKRKPKKSKTTIKPKIRRPFLDTSGRPPFDRTTHTIPTTDRELRGRLNLPRRKLAIWMLTGENGTPDYSIISPQGNCQTDCKSGPLCTIMDNVDVIGQMTSVMKLKFETWEGPPIQFNDISQKGSFVTRVTNFAANIAKAVIPESVVPTPAILSHRWEMSFGWNPTNYLKIRKIKGEVLFRNDVLELRHLSADQLRPYFMSHSIPLGFIRVPDNGEMVKLNSEGTGVVYSITDEQQMMNNPGGVAYGIVKMEAISEYAYHVKDSNSGDTPDVTLKSNKKSQ